MISRQKFDSGPKIRLKICDGHYLAREWRDYAKLFFGDPPRAGPKSPPWLATHAAFISGAAAVISLLECMGRDYPTQRNEVLKMLKTELSETKIG